jgi:acetylornithine/N-succinyldiaminopimelate aminotransferase
VRQRSAYIFDQLTGAPGVEAVSGLGLMIGVKTVKPAREVVMKCLENGALYLTAKDRVRLLPALNIPMDLLERAIAVLKEACR